MSSASIPVWWHGRLPINVLAEQRFDVAQGPQLCGAMHAIVRALQHNIVTPNSAFPPIQLLWLPVEFPSERKLVFIFAFKYHGS